MKDSRDWNAIFRDDLAVDDRIERRLLFKQLLIVAVLVALSVLRERLR